MRLGWICALTVVIGTTVAACKGDRTRCEQAARNWHRLVFWSKADAEIATAAEPRRAALRAEKQALYEKQVENDLPWATERCRAANNDDEVACMIAAKTADEAQRCAPVATDD